MKRALRTTSIVSSIITLLCVAVVNASPVSAIESSGVGAIPANPRSDNPRTKSIFVYQIEAGKTTRDAIKVVNNSDSAKTLAIYPVDSQASSDGAFACAQQADIPKEVGSWLTLAKDRVTLQPKTNETISFTVKVPATADVGEHNGCIAIQDITPNGQQNQNGIVLSFRSALRVAITVPGKLVTNLQLIEVKTKPLAAEKVQITPVVQNLGNVSLDTNFNVKLVNIFGATVASNHGEFPVLRQTTGQFNFELDTPFWGGWYNQQVEASYAQLAQSGGKSLPSNLTNQSKWTFVQPHPIAALIEISTGLLAIAAIVAVIWRYRHHKQLHLRAVSYKVKDGDNLQTIAKAHHVGWQKLATLNKLKPPYILNAGTTIRVPKKADTTTSHSHTAK